MRPRNGSKPIDMSIVRKALEDRRMWCGLAIVVKRENEDSHFEIVQEDGDKVDVFVEIDLMPEEIPVTARLGSFGGGQGTGAWRIPPVGTEVAWMAPMGQLNSDILIVGTLSSQGVPTALDEDTYVIMNPGRVVIASKDDKVFLGSEDGTGTQPAVLGNDLTTRLQNLETAHNNHIHPERNADYPVGRRYGRYAPYNDDDHESPNVKADKVEVK